MLIFQKNVWPVCRVLPQMTSLHLQVLLWRSLHPLWTCGNMSPVEKENQPPGACVRKHEHPREFSEYDQGRCQSRDNAFLRLKTRNRSKFWQLDSYLECEISMIEVEQPIDQHQSSDQRESRFSRILEIFFENSLLDLDFESFDFHFHFSISILSHLIFTFTSRKEWREKIFHFSFLENGEIISYFTLFIKENEWNWV